MATATPRRTHRAAVCTGKTAHTRWAYARREMQLALDRGVRHLNVYHCRYCNKFHVGHLAYADREEIYQ